MIFLVGQLCSVDGKLILGLLPPPLRNNGSVDAGIIERLQYSFDTSCCKSLWQCARKPEICIAPGTLDGGGRLVDHKPEELE